MKENQIQTLFSKKVSLDETAVYELKIEKGTSLPFSKIVDHQIESLRRIECGEGYFYKLTDMPHFAGMKARFDKPKPFDCFVIKQAKAYLAVCFYKPRKPKELLLIRINKFLTWKNSVTRKSLPENIARELAEKIIVL